jgi:hypothetical protein
MIAGIHEESCIGCPGMSSVRPGGIGLDLGKGMLGRRLDPPNPTASEKYNALSLSSAGYVSGDGFRFYWTAISYRRNAAELNGRRGGHLRGPATCQADEGQKSAVAVISNSIHNTR